ncbi:MAG TPA: CYTH and CHAD domain-containing protein [Pseudonocardia sp.]|nr:CYTH and CHAD domain-containing protein [Pseudonocardia sp.]
MEYAVGVATTSIAVVRETERKYEAPDTVDLPDPPESLGVAGDVEDHLLKAIYFDTAELHLLQAGITLRRREGGSDAGWHLKLPAGGDSRDEHRLPLTKTRRPPAKLAKLVLAQTGGAALAPVAELVTERRRRMLADAEGRDAAELVADRVVARTLGKATRTESWREIEVELTEHGDNALLDRIESWLAELGVHRSKSKSKVGRLLADQLPPPTPAWGEKLKPGSAGAAVLEYVQAQADALRKHDAGVRTDAHDAVHQMRVAARRMRSTLQAYGRVLDRDRTRALTEELRWVAGELAGARDTEVMAERFGAMLDELPDELKLGPVQAEITRSFARRETDARTRAIAALDDPRYRDLLARVDALLADPPLAEHAKRPARKELPKNIARVFRTVSRLALAAADLPPGDHRDEAMHDTRKAAKRLRYAIEAAQPAVGEPATLLRTELSKVQDLLGEHQDTVVARPVLRELAVEAHLDGGNGFTLGILHAAEATRAAAIEAALPEAWAELRKPEYTAWLDA